MASGPITSWEIDGETVETVSDFIVGGSKITADVDCSHEVKRHLLFVRKVMTNLDSILKSREVTLLTKVQQSRLWFLQWSQMDVVQQPSHQPKTCSHFLGKTHTALILEISSCSTATIFSIPSPLPNFSKNFCFQYVFSLIFISDVWCFFDKA